MRLPALQKRALEMVPEGAAFFAAGTINPHGDVPPGVTVIGNPARPLPNADA